MDISKLPRSGIENTIKGGRAISSPLFSFKYVKNSSQKTRLAVIVSKKAEKTAVKRNTIKRRLKEALRRSLKDTPFSGDLAVFGNHFAFKVPFSDLLSVMQETLKKI